MSHHRQSSTRTSVSSCRNRFPHLSTCSAHSYPHSPLVARHASSCARIRLLLAVLRVCEDSVNSLILARYTFLALRQTRCATRAQRHAETIAISEASRDTSNNSRKTARYDRSLILLLKTVPRYITRSCRCFQPIKVSFDVLFIRVRIILPLDCTARRNDMRLQELRAQHTTRHWERRFRQPVVDSPLPVAAASLLPYARCSRSEPAVPAAGEGNSQLTQALPTRIAQRQSTYAAHSSTGRAVEIEYDHFARRVSLVTVGHLSSQRVFKQDIARRRCDSCACLACIRRACLKSTYGMQRESDSVAFDSPP